MPIIPMDIFTIAVLNLRQEVSQGKFTVGTGTFIQHGNDLYILTAEHVARAMKANCQFIVKGANDTPITLSLQDLRQGDDLPWKIHPEADMAILPLKPTDKLLATTLAKRFLPSEILDKRKEAVNRETQLRAIGFPLGLGAEKHFSPLTFRTHASSGLITLARADTKKPCTFIVLENPSIGGYSGGPVIDLSIYKNMGMEMTGSGTLIHGIVHGTISDDTGGKLAALTPSYYFFDLV